MQLGSMTRAALLRVPIGPLLGTRRKRIAARRLIRIAGLTTTIPGTLGAFRVEITAALLNQGIESREELKSKLDKNGVSEGDAVAVVVEGDAVAVVFESDAASEYETCVKIAKAIRQYIQKRCKPDKITALITGDTSTELERWLWELKHGRR